MKNLFPISISSFMGLSIALVSHGLAIEAPEDNTPPPVVGEANENQVAFIGVVSSDIPDLLTAHLGIAKGEGILVRSVMPDGPADKAGIKRHDIITHIDGAPTPSPMEFSKLVRDYKPGDTVKLRMVKNGKPAETDALLVNRPQEFRAMGAQPLAQLQLDGVPPEIAERMRGMIEGNIQRLQIPPGAILPQAGDPDIDNAMQELRQKLQEEMKEGANGKPGMIPNLKQSATMKMIDQQGSIELQTKDGKQELTVRDLDNDILWSGPWNTDEDKAKAPEEIRERAGKLKIMKVQPGQLKMEIR